MFFNIPGSNVFDSITVGNYTILSSEYDAGDSGTAKTIDLSASAAQKVTMTDVCTFTLSNPQSGASYVLNIIQSGDAMTWPGTVIWLNSTASPPSDGTAGKRLLVNLYFDGINYLASFAGNYSA